MEAFTYKNGGLHVDDVAIADLSATYGTPLYVYNRSYLTHQFLRLKEAMAEVDPLICFAVKSNSNASVIHTFAEQGAGADVVSGGELLRARRAGIPANKIVFAGVGKTVEEIEFALHEQILSFTVESEPELERISACTQRIGTTVQVDIRVNPDVDPKTHKYTSTGMKENKFGVDLERAVHAYELAQALPGLEIAGLHMHIGSPIMSAQTYVEALEKVAPLCQDLKKKYPGFRHLDMGGGLGIQYMPDQSDLDPREFAAAVLPTLKNLGLQVILEPGRFLTGNAGALITEVQYVKDNAFKKFVVVDAAMNDLIRPALYQAYHQIRPVSRGYETMRGDVVGPVCESGDFLAQDRDIPACKSGDLLAILSAGAYGFAMASNYNSRGRPAEVMVQGTEVKLVRERESWEALFATEEIPEWSSGQ